MLHQKTQSRRLAVWKETGLAYLFLAPSLVLFSIFLFYPLLRTVYLSLHITDPRGRVAAFVGTDNFKELLVSDKFWTSLQVTGLFALFTIPLGIVASLLLAWLTVNRLRGIKVFQFFLCPPNGHFGRYRRRNLDGAVPSDRRDTQLFCAIDRAPSCFLACRPRMGADFCLHNDDMDEPGLQLSCTAQRNAGNFPGNLRERENRRFFSVPYFSQTHPAADLSDHIFLCRSYPSSTYCRPSARFIL